MFPLLSFSSFQDPGQVIRRISYLSILALVLLTVYFTSTSSPNISPALRWGPYVGESDRTKLANQSTVWFQRAERVRNAYIHAYSNYRRYAFPHDEIMPLSKEWQDNFNGWGVSVFDSLDTMYLMRLDEEFSNALDLVERTTFSMEKNATLSVFETTIRYLGGLLSAYALSGNHLLLQKADELAEAMSPAFDTMSGLPWSSVNTVTGDVSGSYFGSLAEVASCQLEYTYLARETGKQEHYHKVDRIMKSLSANIPSRASMLPNHLSTINGLPTDVSYSAGGGADSGHEYLLKYYLLTSHQDPLSLDMYMRTTNEILTKLLYLSPKRSLLYVTDINQDGEASHLFEHLSCFLPGLLALGVHSLPVSAFDNATLLYTPYQEPFLSSFRLQEVHMWAAIGLGESCWLMYADQPTGLGPESVIMNPPPASRDHSRAFNISSGLWVEAIAKWNDGKREAEPPGTEEKSPESHFLSKDYLIYKAQYFLRPETIESMYYLWKVTGDERWRHRAWSIFEAIEQETKTEAGYASLLSVETSPAVQLDEMPSYFLAETLKYLYLFMDESDRVPLDMWVFNTEAHPLPIFTWTEAQKSAFNITR
ncbi:glycoside hydrolase [Cristinia sonorae]|uniref:alpha-1,2-Mannosidase n=1 Tax=Cristinia sonorae TaxID=1940300 RepID=A0A8K0XSN1_9AGAR|nr:glycoside hydrolase [Cristinia sonorae]